MSEYVNKRKLFFWKLENNDDKLFSGLRHLSMYADFKGEIVPNEVNNSPSLLTNTALWSSNYWYLSFTLDSVHPQPDLVSGLFPISSVKF